MEVLLEKLMIDSSESVQEDKAFLPDVQSKVLDTWGIAKEPDYKKYSTWGSSRRRGERAFY
jgi:hypothetical protein